MSGLIVVVTTAAGTIIGGGAGMFAAMLWADMEPGSFSPLIYMTGGAMAGAALGAYAGGQLVG